ATAHDTFWDFISLTPESMHMVMWIMSDRTLPRSLSMMEGFGIHSFRLVNAAGESTFVKFHWRPKLGLQSTLWDETMKLAGADPDFHRRELFEAISAGNFPEWEFAVQLFTEDQATQFPFDHLDATKLIPEELVPLQVIGRMVLNRWPDNFFAETEQVAFCPSHLVPGIDFSNDPLLQGRLFSYLDTQLSRLGSPNFHQLPINAPKCPYANQQRDGQMQMAQPSGRVAYEPNSLTSDSPSEHLTDGFISALVPENGVKMRARSASFADHYSQARQFYLSLSKYEQAHLRSALVFELSKVEHPHIHKAMIAHLRNIEEDLALRVATGLGIFDLPPAVCPAHTVQEFPLSPPLQLIGKAANGLQGRAVGLLIADGSDKTIIDALEKALLAAGAKLKLIALSINQIRLSEGSFVKANGQLAGTPSVLFDAIAIVLTHDAAMILRKESGAIDFVRDAYSHLKAIGVDQGGQALLQYAGVEKDLGIIDLTQPENLVHFLDAATTRQWEREHLVRTLP
uniref:catalase n=1 Tax=Undibacterium sp. TaxID=1914977 RepID=UPI0037526CE3